MQYQAASPNDYVAQLPEEHKQAIESLRKIFKENLPEGFVETINYGMIGYVVPHSLYPAGYHCDPTQPLPFLALASQKNFIAVYSNSLYASKELLAWFVAEFPKHSHTKLDMGKSCIRFKKANGIPYQLLGQLAAKMTVAQWIELYEQQLKKQR